MEKWASVVGPAVVALVMLLSYHLVVRLLGRCSRGGVAGRAHGACMPPGRPHSTLNSQPAALATAELARGAALAGPAEAASQPPRAPAPTPSAAQLLQPPACAAAEGVLLPQPRLGQGLPPHPGAPLCQQQLGWCAGRWPHGPPAPAWPFTQCQARRRLPALPAAQSARPATQPPAPIPAPIPALRGR